MNKAYIQNSDYMPGSECLLAFGSIYIHISILKHSEINFPVTSA